MAVGPSVCGKSCDAEVHPVVESNCRLCADFQFLIHSAGLPMAGLPRFISILDEFTAVHAA